MLKSIFFFFFKQKTAYEIYQCDWSSDVCSSDLSKKIEHAEKHTDPTYQPASQQMWEQLSNMVYDYLNTISLADVHNASKQQIENEQDSSETRAA